MFRYRSLLNVYKQNNLIFLVTEVDVEADEEETITETSSSRSASKPAGHPQKKRRGSSIECHSIIN